MLKFFALAPFDFSRMDAGRELLDLRACLFNLSAQVRIWRQRRFSQPVMTDHSFFVGIREPSRFQVAHRGKRPVDLRSHFVEEIVRELHTADVDRETEIVVAKEVLLEPLPERRRSHLGKDNGGTTSVSFQKSDSSDRTEAVP